MLGGEGSGGWGSEHGALTVQHGFVESMCFLDAYMWTENMADWHGGCKQPDDHGIIRDCDVFHKWLFEVCCMLYFGSRAGCLGVVLVPSCFWQQSETESFGADVACKVSLDSKAGCLGVVLVPSCFLQQSKTESFGAEVICKISLYSKASCLEVVYGQT